MHALPRVRSATVESDTLVVELTYLITGIDYRCLFDGQEVEAIVSNSQLHCSVGDGP